MLPYVDTQNRRHTQSGRGILLRRAERQAQTRSAVSAMHQGWLEHLAAAVARELRSGYATTGTPVSLSTAPGSQKVCALSD